MATTHPQLYSGRLRPFPGNAGQWHSEKHAKAALVMQELRRTFPDMLTGYDPNADVEDFWEDACRLSAALNASGFNLVTKAPGTPDAPWNPEEMAKRLGPVSTIEEGGHHAGDKLVDHPVLRKHGGRAMVVGSLGGDQSTDVAEWLATRYREHGVQRGIVKATARKSGIWSIPLHWDPVIVRRSLMEEMGWAYVRLEEAPGAVMAQDVIDLQWEYRLFVVDGEVVSGAGCVEEFTPIDAAFEQRFDRRIRRIRGHLHQGEPTEVENQPAIAERLIRFGREVAAEHGGTVVIDVAIDAGQHGPDGRPVVVELNGISNSGLYASNPWVVAEKLVHAKDRGYLL